MGIRRRERSWRDKVSKAVKQRELLEDTRLRRNVDNDLEKDNSNAVKIFDGLNNLYYGLNMVLSRLNDVRYFFSFHTFQFYCIIF